MNLQSKVIEAADGVKLAYRTVGSGSPVMLLHGFPQWSEMWIENGVAEHLANSYRVILPDRRGHGMSGRPTEPERYGRRFVEDVFDILDAEELSSVHLVGFSQGSEVALSTACTRPDRVRSIYLMASGWPGPELATALQGYADFLDWLPTAISERGSWLTPDPDLEVFQAIVESIAEVIDIPEHVISELNIHSAGVAGENDPERPNIERLVGLLPDFEADILPRTDHGGTWKHPSIANRIQSFLDTANAVEN